MLSGFEDEPEGIAKFEAAFAELAECVRSFAKLNGLAVSGFYHGFPGWHLAFSRKVGGRAYLQIALQESHHDRSLVSAVWFLDDLQSRRRFIKLMKSPIAYLKGQKKEQLLDSLSTALDTVDSWKLGEWDSVFGPFENWTNWMEEDLADGSAIYPLRD